MWSLEKQGKGRRAKILSISNEKETYRSGDFVACDDKDFVGIVAALKQGETENTHQVELLQLLHGSENEEGELLATSILKWYPVSVLGDKLEPKPHPKKAISSRLSKDRIVDIDRQCDENVREFANYVAAQFISTPRRRGRAARTRVSPKQESRDELESESLAESFDDSDSSDFSLEDADTLPTRKRAQVFKHGETSRAPASAKRIIDVPELPSHSVSNQQASEASLVQHQSRSAHSADEFDSGSQADVKANISDADVNASGSPQRTPRKARAPATRKKTSPTKAASTPKASPSKSSPRKRTLVGRHDDVSIPHLSAYADSSSDDDGSEAGSILPVTPRKRQKQKSIPNSPVKMRILRTDTDKVLANLHPATSPDSYPCRDSQFDQLFYAVEGAIEAETGTCIYVSGTPGTGKTSTIKEVLAQLYLRVNDNELKPFTFLEINGMKLVHPNAAYEHLWEVMGNKSMAASNAMTALEAAFTKDDDRDTRGVIVVLLDELDQLVTKGQQLMYNFFNWPSLPNSRLVVIAVANTMDLPERILSNKISSRVGLTRIQFPGYTQEQLKSIVLQRLGPDQSVIDPNAIDYVTRKVAGVGGDARRVLDFTRKGIVHARAELRKSLKDSDAKQEALNFQVKISHIRDVIVESQTPPTVTYIKTLGVTAKVLLCAVLMRSRREDDTEVPLHDVLKQARQLVRASANAKEMSKWLFPASAVGNSGRIAYFQPAIMELVEAGILVQQAIAGEATPKIRLMIPGTLIRECLENDAVVKGMI